MSEFRTLDDVQVSGKWVLLRGDLNVPLKDGAVSDVTRLERLATTIRELVAKKAKVIVLSHFGRPKGKPDASMSLKIVADALGKCIRSPVAFCPETVGDAAEKAVAALKDGDVIVMENTRFHKGEEENDPAFARQLAQLGDIFVNDAFSAAHRAHASTEGIAHLLPSAAGREMQAEMEAITSVLDNPQRPVGAIVGGSKISTKLDLLKNMCGKVNYIILGGAMANTFLAASGNKVGASMYEADMLETARSIIQESEKQGCKIVLPVDVVVAKELKENTATQTVAADAIPDDARALDAGPQSVKVASDILAGCKTILWNGPLGVFEVPPFNAATNAIGKVIADLTQSGKARSVAGGGDTAAAVNQAGVADKLTYVSTAGGAFLEWLEGRTLPGVEILRKSAAPTKKAMA